jgi:hypothetical protein
MRFVHGHKPFGYLGEKYGYLPKKKMGLISLLGMLLEHALGQNTDNLVFENRRGIWEMLLEMLFGTKTKLRE